MLAAGGNAVDAAIATAACMTIVEPCSNGLGSDAFCILWDGNATARPQRQRPGAGGVDARATSCASTAQAPRTPPQRGWDSVSVPGAVAAWAALSQRFGKLPFADLMAPAAEIAERGYAVPVVVQQKWTLASKVAELVAAAGLCRRPSCRKGRPPEVGERFAMPHAARALKLIGATKGEAFYRGEIAAGHRRLVAASTAAR